jgi:hypothetical protein
VLKALYTRWWKQQDGGGKCVEDSSKDSQANALQIANVGGVFVMLVGGIIISLLVGIFEFFYYAVRHPKKDKVTPTSRSGHHSLYASSSQTERCYTNINLTTMAANIIIC